ncbi:hypothetical protein DPMN_032184 [Dreissena polymorpha]|uniref:Uncharacterized protein n=1 Tax=Dreissena polymorpha TaxID=45954 RepID=A0A9D4M3S5_DREPO|nr:hypothetical protein DPMN_032184 [Dreissena polymorpha]
MHVLVHRGHGLMVHLDVIWYKPFLVTVQAYCRHGPIDLVTDHRPEVVEKVISMGAFVTPIGYKGSAFNHIEWRICFHTAETELVKNLNDTQIKIYVILKMIINEILKPETKKITSYTLLNIELWLAENNPQTMFHTGSLFHWLHET